MSSLGLLSSVSSIKGIGPKKQKVLEKLEVFTVEDLLYYFPRTYEDRRNKVKIANLVPGQPSVIEAKVISKENPPSFKGSRIPFKLKIKDETGIIEVVFFQAKYMNSIFQIGKSFIFFGTPTKNYNGLQLIHPDFHPAEEGAGPEILPVYPLTEGLGQRDIRKWEESLMPVVDEITEYMPKDTIERNNLISINDALRTIHFPKDVDSYKKAKHRLVFEELLELRLGLTLLKNNNNSNEEGISFSKDVDLTGFTDRLPYELTDAQKRVVKEIESDMEGSTPMNRLVQGDVGSGKTVVAAIAMYKAVKSGFQAVMMAPTEILASQHFIEISKLFEDLDVKVGYLTGSIKKSERDETLKLLKEGEIDIIIGTHALIQDDVDYRNLGLAITDEQHRFGVRQRVNLSEKGKNADVLVMTATPIPRTLAFILYGDLDISIIDELPPGRKKIITAYRNGPKRKGVYDFVKTQLAEGRQAYVVSPLIEDSDVMEQLKSAETLYDELRKEFKGFSVALLHGAMKQSEKDEIMDKFNKNEIQMLVSTVVIEVGINVKNATMMVIENAERFGLAQLHQLRGRVGRGEHKSYCVLISDSETDVAKDRLELMTKTDDGFVISEKDLEMRGPGDLFGLRQHGLPQMRISDLVKHADMLNIIKEESKYILDVDPKLISEENQGLKMKIDRMFISVSKIGL